jgi:hypothetical protein
MRCGVGQTRRTEGTAKRVVKILAESRRDMLMSDALDALENVVRNSFAGVVWTHKIHEKQADIYVNRYKCLEIIRIIAASLTSAGIVSSIFCNEMRVKLASAIISFISVAISALFKSFNIQDLCANHKKAAITLLVLRDKYQHLLLSIRTAQKAYEELDNDYLALEAEKHSVYMDLPITTDGAVKLAKIALQVSKDNEFTDEEVDCYLPRTLHKGIE